MEDNAAVRLGIIKASMYLGYLVMIGLGLAMAVFDWSDGNASLAILFCVAIFTGNFFGFLGMEKPSKDERARKIGTYAATYSWYITLIAMCFLMIFDIAFGMRLSVARFFGIVLLVMVMSMMVINAYKQYRGDVE
ncbi:MAG TPA: DUF2178 domain-containing protein [Methanocella sp.]|uniref:DUF2178 domain-containing protein n=1 Tax=Methanocella sp. TaxID=2052833 RepID=UPI002BD95250|nr:DUF2178 domain-containing protein [Methanocella sp.]HTY90934.1 DUF2178 domain-containing protein [Methanocella sp.]